MMERDGKPVGSALIAQGFTDPKYFWPRPSACGYNGAGGSGSNLAPTNPALKEAVQARTDGLRAADPGNTSPIPIDLITASASGLDPHLSVAATRYQLARVARARSVPAAQLDKLIAQHTEKRTFGLLGEERVNVLQLNLALDESR
jgi:K+-transporting ATPase ATPase C chain